MNEYDNKMKARVRVNPWTNKEYFETGFKRNKRDIEDQIIYAGDIYQFKQVIDGTYNKALVYRCDRTSNEILMSFKTIVAEYDYGNECIYVHGWYSKTTQGHINAFLQLLGAKTMDKKTMRLSANKPIKLGIF